MKVKVSTLQLKIKLKNVPTAFRLGLLALLENLAKPHKSSGRRGGGGIEIT